MILLKTILLLFGYDYNVLSDKLYPQQLPQILRQLLRVKN
ncbi:hypothetical protein M106_3487 [Bacteroides fragilis str. 1009-4-F |nr:hypothetical protein M144_3571 [Bacteroides fragilis str. 3-F-2 \